VSAKENVINALETGLRAFFALDSTSEAIKSENITRWKTNFITRPPSATPAIFVIDQGETIAEVDDGAATRYVCRIDLQVLVKVDSKADAISKLNGIVGELTKYCETESLDTSEFLHLRVQSVSDHRLYLDNVWADCVVTTSLRFTRARGAA
jgi:hypothetical protein